jgi:thiamine kinase-like enzyme
MKEDSTFFVREVANTFLESPADEKIPTLGNGHINDTYLVSDKNNGNRIVLQKINTHVFRDPRKVVDNHLTIYHHLKQQSSDLKILEPIKNISGDYLYIDKHRQAWRAVTFIPDTFAIESTDTTDIIYSAAKMLGLYLRELSNLSAEKLHDTIPNFHNSILRTRVFSYSVAQGIPERTKQAKKEIQWIREQQSVFIKITRLSLPVRAVHNDAKIGNILFDKKSGQACAVIDWDTTMGGSVLSDFGDMVRTIASTTAEDDPDLAGVEIDYHRFEALTRGWLDGVGAILTQVERENLLLGAHWLILEQAIRFLGDYLMGDKYYKIKYPEHNLVRAKNQLKLFHSFIEQESALQKLIL